MKVFLIASYMLIMYNMTYAQCYVSFVNRIL